MNISLFVTVAAATLSFSAVAQANTIVDTGTPRGANDYSLNSGQSLAGYFGIANATVISGVQGYISNFSAPGSVTATLYSDGSVPDAANTLFTTTFMVPTSGFRNYDWFGATGLNWAVGAGNYWLSFATDSGMTMLDGAPSPLTRYAFSDGANYRQSNGLGIGVRVFDNIAAVPEPATWAMMIGGMGVVGGAMRRRRSLKTNISFA